MSAFFRRFMAKKSPDFLFLASITLPKEPTASNSKVSVHTVGLVRPHRSRIEFNQRVMLSLNVDTRNTINIESSPHFKLL